MEVHEAATAFAALRITLSTASGCDSIGTRLDVSSVGYYGDSALIWYYGDSALIWGRITLSKLRTWAIAGEGFYEA